MRLDFGVYFGLMVVSLGFAYYASLPKSQSDATIVANIEPNIISKLTYTAEELNVIAERREDDRFWVTFVRYKKPEDPKAGEGASPDTADKVVDTELRFLASSKLSDQLQKLSPFEADRVIGSVGEDSLAEFGLTEAEIADFQVFDKGAQQIFHLAIGKKSYGSRNFFVKNFADNKVLLVDGGLFESLKKAEFRLFERKIMAFEFEDVTHATIVKGQAEKRLAHTKRDKSGQLSWSDDSDDATINPSYKSWMDKIERLRLMSYASSEELPAIRQAAELMRIVLEKDGSVRDTLVFKKVPEGEKTNYWVQSEFLGTFAKVSENRLGPVEKDLTTILDNAQEPENTP